VIDFSLGLHIIEFGAQVRRDLGIHKSRLKHQGVILNIMFEKSRLSYIKMRLKGYPTKYGSPEGYLE
jgi:hypothetical protein